MSFFSTHKTHKGCYHMIRVWWESVSPVDKVQALKESCLWGYLWHKTVVFTFTGFISYTVTYSNIYMVPFKWNITYPQNSLCCSSLKQPFEFASFAVTISHVANRYVEYYYILVHRNVNSVSKQTRVIAVTQHDVKIPTAPILVNVMLIWL